MWGGGVYIRGDDRTSFIEEVSMVEELSLQTWVDVYQGGERLWLENSV